MEALRDMHLPPGFGFHPSDAELVSHYLKRKIHGQKIEYDLIPEVDIYKHEPWDLPAKCNLPIEDNKWHFFASRDRKYPTGSRSNRATIAGYWKSTGKDRAIKLNKRTLGTKKTLVFHEGRPPSGRRTEWIMHEYYIDENECQACPDMKDAFVLCRVTKRNDWALENDNEVSNGNPHRQQLNNAAPPVVSAGKQEDAAASVVCTEEPNHVAAPVVSDEVSNDVAMAPVTADTLNGVSELQALLEELIDSSYVLPVMDTGSADLSLTEQHAESWNFQNPGSMALKMEPDHASPMQNGADDTDYLLTEDIRNILYPGIDDFNDAFATNQSYSMMGMDHFTFPNNFEDGAWKEEPQLEQGNCNPNMSNENVDNGITIRRRNARVSAASISASGRKSKLQVGVNRMVTSNSESINQTIEFSDNHGRLDLMTNIEHRRRNHANDVVSVKLSDAAKSNENHSNRGYFRGIKNAFRCSSAGLNVLFTICVIGIAAVVLHRHYCSDISL